MKVYFDGCSWTYGTDLDDVEKERYSKLVCKQLDAEEGNFALKGGSNDRIVRNLLVENNIREYDLAIIQMTLPPRTEFYMNDKWHRVNPRLNYMSWLHKPEKSIDDIKHWCVGSDGYHNDLWKKYYKVTSEKEYFSHKEKIHYQAIRDHCKVNDVPLILCSINPWTSLDFDLKMNELTLPVRKYSIVEQEEDHKVRRAMRKHVQDKEEDRVVKKSIPDKEGHRRLADRLLQMYWQRMIYP